jgi:hypothetical protein
MTKNYFHIEDAVDLVDLFNALPVLSEDGILILMGVPNSEIKEKLKEFEITDINFPDIGKSFTFGFFKKIEEKNIAIKFGYKTKNILIELSKKNVPNTEICSYLYYLKNDKSMILEYVVDNDIFISRDIIKNDETVRAFCKKIDINRYCLEEFE